MRKNQIAVQANDYKGHTQEFNEKFRGGSPHSATGKMYALDLSLRELAPDRAER